MDVEKGKQPDLRIFVPFSAVAWPATGGKQLGD